MARAPGPQPQSLKTVLGSGLGGVGWGRVGWGVEQVRERVGEQARSQGSRSCGAGPGKGGRTGAEPGLQVRNLRVRRQFHVLEPF